MDCDVCDERVCGGLCGVVCAWCMLGGCVCAGDMYIYIYIYILIACLKRRRDVNDKGEENCLRSC